MSVIATRLGPNLPPPVQEEATRTSWTAEGSTRYRVSFAHWDIKDGRLALSAPAPKFIGAPTHYIDGVGFVINRGAEYTEVVGAPPTTRIATVIVIWPTTKEGLLDATSVQDFEVTPWVMGNDKYQILKVVHSEFPLGQHDVIIAPNGGEYTTSQRMVFQPCRDSVLATVMVSEKATALARGSSPGSRRWPRGLVIIWGAT